MKCPSIDRIDSNGHYIFSNCRFIELKENLRRGIKRVPIAQYNLNGVLIKTWNSIIKASKMTDIRDSSISLCASGKLKTAGGFVWKKI